ncbi:hypothetical protein L226DRAFT_539420 [Lentinus tigrinus ALCF2SS1-7]|uniref:Zn(2)-C6 fungal-type domain-containing protein n=1 Tax=Lentinus tigrinus ALCF2SS1-6 TaxID=1328759 RepID=A0A5C2S569_9APHY|nr:hypothetical protein L227DRAFT_576826 [Lentinus tigrinus ALCF2SS1-6]RPD69774.1 hypothetical protein L226DRAFT_539420 [Lentinus tigrinus ALCF2SS1-7]
MSSAEEDSAPFTKKRKIQRACDGCRRRKIKCDGADMPENRCSRCVAGRIACTYNDSHSKSTYPRSYVEKLESRVERMERLINQLCPDTDVSTEPDGQVPDGSTTRSLRSEGSRASTSRSEGPLRSLPMTPQIPGSPDEDYLSDYEEDVENGLTETLRELSVSSPESYRYHGKSSGLVLVRTAMEMRNQQLGGSGKFEPQERAAYRYPWLRSDSIPVFYNFPPDDLLSTLVDLYFRNVNDMLPLLHEPTMKDGISNGLHVKDGGFGAVVLLVCACASRFTDDPRVLLEGTEDRKSAGWKWFQAVEDWRKITGSLAPAQLHDLQICVLMAHFLIGSSAPQANWSLIGSGIRMAVDVGAHRNKMYKTKPTIEDELWRRAFWILVLFEWSNCYGLGRPASIHDEDIDAALPTEIDDEYWPASGSEEPPSQPEGKPSKVAFLAAHIRLARNLAFATRTVYSINRSKLQLGQGDAQWEQRIVAELDSSLNNWLDSLPVHLRWNPDQEDTLFLTQSATLYANYYHTQIAVHRPFMSASRRESPLSLPSVIICTNAARSGIQTLDVLYRRTGNPYHRNMGLLFMSGIVLMMNVWGQKRAGRFDNVDKDVAVLRRAMTMLESLKTEVQVSGALRDLLAELVEAVENPPPATDSTSHPSTSTAGAEITAHSTSSPYVSAPATVPQPSETHGFHSTTSTESMPRQAFLSTQGFETSNIGEPSTSGTGPLGVAENGFFFPFTFGLDQQSIQHAPDMASYGISDGEMTDFAFMDDTLSMWMDAPSSFSLDEWGAYISSGHREPNSGPAT